MLAHVWLLLPCLALAFAVVPLLSHGGAASVSAQTPGPTETLPPTQTPGQPTPTATAVPPETPAPTASPIATGSPTPTPGLPDLVMGVFGAPDPVPPGAPLRYTLTVFNVGGLAAGPFNVIDPIPEGTTLVLLEPGCALGISATVTCRVDGLEPGASRAFSFVVNVVQGGGVITNLAIADPENVVAEADERNNGATILTTVLPPPPPPGNGAPAFPSPTPVPPVEEPAPPPPAPLPAPAPVSGEGQIWLQILAPTQTYAVDDTPMWVAQPGEWYYVELQEDGWALAIWEGDPPEYAVWIDIDDRVQVVVADRPVPPGDLWLLVLAPTPAYAPNMAPAWIGSPGEWYEVSVQEPGWVLGVWEHDPPNQAVWIAVDGRVELLRV